MDRLLLKDPSARCPSAAFVAGALAEGFGLGEELSTTPTLAPRPTPHARQDLLEALLDIASRANLFGAWEDAPPGGVPDLFVVLEGEPELGKGQAIKELALRIQTEGVQVREAEVFETAAPLEPLKMWWPKFPVPDLAGIAEGPSSILEDLDLALARTLCDSLPHLTRGRPLLLVLRGLENASPILVSILHSLARFVAEKSPGERPAVLLLATLEREEGSIEDDPSVRKLRDSPIVSFRRVKPLDLEGSTGFLTALFDGNPLPELIAGLLHQASGGRPGNLADAAWLLVREKTLVQEPDGWRFDLPRAEEVLSGASARPLLLRRLETLSLGAREVFELLAVAARPIPPSQLDEITRRTDWWIGLEELRTRGLARSVGRSFALTAPPLGRAAAFDLDPAYHRNLHLRYLRLLDSLPRQDSLPHLAHRARHAHHAALPQSHELCRRAGNALRAGGDLRVARRLLSWALEDAPDLPTAEKAQLLNDLCELCLSPARSVNPSCKPLR
ncbi:MAG: hypothetical protein ABIH26_12630, partial [Candidatus Eisenbacteria bacterium]